jgi:hypothetical protein
LLVLQLLLTLAMAACPELHHAFHPNSNRPDHHCLVTLLAKGLLSGPETTAVVSFVAVFVICALRLPDIPPRLLFQYRFALSRAPPRF